MMSENEPNTLAEADGIETNDIEKATPKPKALDRDAVTKAKNAAFDALPDDDLADQDDVSGEDVDPELIRLLEAILFASSEPITERGLGLRLPDKINVKALLKNLRQSYEGRGIFLVRRGGSWAFRTAPDLGARLNIEVEISRRLSRAAIETLAIIAYHQPVTRGEIEEIRGVSLSKGTLDLLFDEGWIKPRGHRDTPGRPLQWGTTDTFLDHFELESVSQLPGLKDLRAMGLLDARPALEAYTVRGEMQSSEDVQGSMEFSESEIEHADHHAEDGPIVEPEPHAAPLIVPMPNSVRKSDQDLDRSGASKNTANKLDAAMGAVADAVKSAVKALETDKEEDEDDKQS